jgi:ankyrin repeat protein
MKLAACLILYSANVDSVDANKYSAVHLATARGNLDMVQLLVDSGAKISEKR